MKSAMPAGTPAALSCSLATAVSSLRVIAASLLSSSSFLLSSSYWG
nr:MAG TPA: hypothetical protein [Caudoviricetes sp.]